VCLQLVEGGLDLPAFGIERGQSKIAPKKHGSKPHLGAIQDSCSWFVTPAISILKNEFFERRSRALV
jgi:hypothetical protein